MAEGVFRNLTAFNTSQASPLVKSIDSCGTGAYHAGDFSDSRTMSVLADNGIKGYRHAARKLKSPSDFRDFDYIFAMDENNLDDLRAEKRRAIKKGSLREEECGKIMLFGVFGGKGEEEVGDPYYGGRDGFEVAYEQVSRFSKGFLGHLKQETSAAGDGQQ